MKSNEAVLSVAAFALLLTTFCVVALTAGYTDKVVGEPVCCPSSTPREVQSADGSIRNPANNLAETRKEPEPSRALSAADVSHSGRLAGKPQMQVWSANCRDRETDPDSRRTAGAKDSTTSECTEGAAEPDPGEENDEPASDAIE